MNGIINLKKEAGMTSHDAVFKLRKIWITFITKIATITATMTTRLNTIIVFPIPSRFDRILIPKISPITKSTPHNGAKIFANAFRSYFINFPSMLRPSSVYICMKYLTEQGIDGFAAFFS